MKALGCVLLAVLLSGCATAPRLAVPEPVIAPKDRARMLGLEAGDCAAPRWSMSGRVALSNGRDGGSGRITWSQGGGVLRLELSAPVTRQSWTLEIAADGAVLSGILPEPQRGPDAVALVRDAFGWDVPISALGCWLRAVEAGPSRFGPARIEFDGDGLPRHLEQAGWSVDYDGWKQDANSGLPMPIRVTASRDGSRVRLVIDRWSTE